jgi:hypothetical protein
MSAELNAAAQAKQEEKPRSSELQVTRTPLCSAAEESGHRSAQIQDSDAG